MLDDVMVSPYNDPVAQDETESEAILGDGKIIDCITGERPVKDTPKEQVRQFIAKALEKEYGISFEDMEADFPIGEGKRRKTVDIAIFHPQHEHKIIYMCKIRIRSKQGGGLKSGINEVSSTVSKQLWRQRGCSDIWNDQPFTF